MVGGAVLGGAVVGGVVVVGGAAGLRVGRGVPVTAAGGRALLVDVDRGADPPRAPVEGCPAVAVGACVAGVTGAAGGGCQGGCVVSTKGRTVSGLTGPPAKLTPTIPVYASPTRPTA
ncbi:GTPase [Micromonospora sp. DT47]|uniref:GTPase n=1 Tax=Micromonospora sp. DT47 TaxID=3393431 RepID=UPI003CF5EB88